MTLKMIFCLLVLLIGVAGCVIHSIKAKRDPECGSAYYRNIYWAMGYAVVALVGFGFSLDYFEPAAPTMEELNANPAWHNWAAGGLFALCVAFFAYSVYRAFKK